MNSVLITGGNRGIGYGLVKAFAEMKNPPKNIMTTYRKTSDIKELKDVADKYNIKLLNLDLKNMESFKDLVNEVGSVVKEDGLNVLINNAGITEKFSRLPMAKMDKILENFQVNTVAPIMLSKEMIPLLKASAQKNKSLPMGVSRGVIVNVSSVMGSIEGNKDGGFYAYRCSKAALNQATKSMSIDLKSNGIMAICIHPGWVKTQMGGPNAPLTVDQVAPVFIKTIVGLTEDKNGSYIDYQGKSIPW